MNLLRTVGIFVAVFCVVGVVTGDCEPGWAEFKEDCIYFSKGRNSWLSSETDCKNRGGWLASDDSNEKHAFLTTILNVLRNLRVYPVFIGASDFAFEGVYRWIETGVSIGSFNKWQPGYPNGTTNNNCISLNWVGTSLFWTDANCNDRSHYYVCEKPNNASQIIGRR